MSFEPDPRAVLKHLHDLGYYNISPQQLQEFIKDLKKLMKYYDTTKKKLVTQSQRTEDSTSSTLPNTTDESLSPSPPPPATVQRKHRLIQSEGAYRKKETEEVSCSSSEFSDVPTRRVLRECTKLSSQQCQQKENLLKDKLVETSEPPKPSKSCDCVWRKIGCKCCDKTFSKEHHSTKNAKSKENLAPPRPKSSFIRTWQLTGQARPGSAPQRSDPVALFQQYQQMWKQQKLPGENNHNDLRWAIRERMLGQEPHPRPLSQASSLTSISRQRKRL